MTLKNAALIAEERDGKIFYEYRGMGASGFIDYSDADELRAGGMFSSQREEQEVPEKYPEGDLEEAESLESFVRETVFGEYVSGNRIQLGAVWINGKGYKPVKGSPRVGVLVEVENTFQYEEDYNSEFGEIDEEKLQNLDREVIDFRER